MLAICVWVWCTSHLDDDVVGVVVPKIDNLSDDGESDIGNAKRGLGPHDNEGEQEQNDCTHPVHPVAKENLPVPFCAGRQKTSR